MKNIVLLAIIFFVAACTTPPNKEDSSSTVEVETEESVTTEEGVSFLNIVGGSKITSPFSLEMGVEGMIVEPKGTPREGYGHHHLLINDDFAPAGTVIVADETHIHYGGGQTSDSVALDPGTYKLTLQFADGMHVSYGENWSKTITVNVQ